MNWFTTKIAEGAALDVLLARLDAEVEQARRAGGLAFEAEVYIVVLEDGVQLFVDEGARSRLAVIGSLALLPSPPPIGAERGRSLLARESGGA